MRQSVDLADIERMVQDERIARRSREADSLRALARMAWTN